MIYHGFLNQLKVKGRAQQEWRLSNASYVRIGFWETGVECKEANKAEKSNEGVCQHGSKCPQLAQESLKWRASPEEGGAVVSLVTASYQCSEPADKDNVCELQNGGCFASTLQLLHDNPSCGPL